MSFFHYLVDDDECGQEWEEEEEEEEDEKDTAAMEAESEAHQVWILQLLVWVGTNMPITVFWCIPYPQGMETELIPARSIVLELGIHEKVHSFVGFLSKLEVIDLW